MVSLKAISSVQILAKHGNSRIAAEIMGVSPTSFGRYIRLAEDYVGHKLFVRMGTSVVPSPVGRQFLENAIELGRSIDNFESGLERLRSGVDGPIRIACSPMAANPTLITQLAESYGQNSRIQAAIQVLPSRRSLEALRTGEVDLVLCDLLATTDFTDLEVRALGTYTISFWTRPDHPLQSEKHPSITQIHHYPLIASNLPEDWWKTSSPQFVKTPNADCQPEALANIESEDVALIGNLAAKSDMICCGTDENLAVFREAGRLKQLAIQTSQPQHFCMARRSSAVPFSALDKLWDRVAEMY